MADQFDHTHIARHANTTQQFAWLWDDCSATVTGPSSTSKTTLRLVRELLRAVRRGGA